MKAAMSAVANEGGNHAGMDFNRIVSPDIAELFGLHRDIANALAAMPDGDPCPVALANLRSISTARRGLAPSPSKWGGLGSVATLCRSGFGGASADQARPEVRLSVVTRGVAGCPRRRGDGERSAARSRNGRRQGKAFPPILNR